MTDFAARLLHCLATSFARLPWPLAARRAPMAVAASAGARRRCAQAQAWCGATSNWPTPSCCPAQRDAAGSRAILRTTARQLLETLRFWTRPHASNLALIRESHGVDLFDAAIAAGKGVIVAAPHYGNWELLNQWLASRTPLAILYRAAGVAIGEAFLRRVRAAHGDADRVTQVRAEGPAIRQLFKLLQGGGVVGILPDQQPKAGDGEFAPFFGIPALTMTLLDAPGAAHRRDGAVRLLRAHRRTDRRPGVRVALRSGARSRPTASPRSTPRSNASRAAIPRNTSGPTSASRSPRPAATLGNPYWPDCYPASAQRAALATRPR